MPGFNRRGPMGEGPMTGRRIGRCTGYGSNIEKTETTRNQRSEDIPEYFPRGFGFGRGRAGRGFGRQFRFRGGC
jgi:hypothetical protein